MPIICPPSGILEQNMHFKKSVSSKVESLELPLVGSCLLHVPRCYREDGLSHNADLENLGQNETAPTKRTMQAEVLKW